MSLALSIAVYFIIWWIALFVVLPFGYRSQEEAGEVVLGTPEGAPHRFSLGRVLAINTLVSSLIFAAVWLAIWSDVIPSTLFDFAAPAFTTTR